MIMTFANSMRDPTEYVIPLHQMAAKHVHITMLLL